MKITDVPFAVLRLQYQFARFPLQVIEDRVVGRLDAEAPARLFYERSLGMLDLAVGNALGAPEVEQRGAALVERSEALRRAAALDTAATQTKEQADAELNQTREQAKREQQQAREEKQREVSEARETAQKRKQDAAEAAQKRTAAAKEQADAVAAQRVKSAEQVRKQEESEIRAAEKATEKIAEAKLGDAVDKKSEAAARRAKADRVEDLADTEKETRQAQNAAKNGSA
ncbi:IF2 family translation initiation factor [Mycobacterium sp. 852013-51886_SCH5428379]|uniref:IF2 family translation initiation factor n=1 Tax=Mycobacterium sp. 852013-51886_SCH5428379 TaxID=1834111 RepID=UPI0007FC6180|nr:IF2 family translation initiation factor [Mycobacterium sp. 852013-51886_SCH5428379]OBB59468.1 IF2 family translation initiation factor [Mycobacterium sp. 852013-51886_SCH5428379]